MTNTSDSTITYRRFEMQRDFDSLVNLLQAVEQNDQDGEDVSEEALRDQLTWFGHDPSLDRWIAITENDAELIGSGAIFVTPNDEHADLYIAVHPAWRQRGIASKLLAHLQERLYELNAQDMRVYANANNEAANAFLHAHGFAPRSTYTRMSVATTQNFPPPVFPEGFVVKNYAQVQRIELFTEATNESYTGLWGHRHVTEEEVSPWSPALTPEGLFLLFAPDGTIAGISRADISRHLTELRGVPSGLIDALGVVPAYRDANLYVPLLLTALQWLLSQKPESIELESWSDAPETIVLYQHLGFTITQKQISYQRDLKLPNSLQRVH
jgi:mycothiol synthase